MTPVPCQILRLRRLTVLFPPAAQEIEKELGIATCPINWPIGSGKNFKGVYDRSQKKIMTFADTLKGTKEGVEKDIDLDDPALAEEIGEDYKAALLEEIELLDGASAEFDMELVPGLGLHTLRAVNYHHCRVRRHQRTVGILRKVLMPRRVQDIDTVPAVIKLQDR